MRRGGPASLLLLLVGCAALGGAEREARLAGAVAALDTAGFPFEADVRLRPDELVGCDGVACADVVLEAGRRTIRVGEAAFHSEGSLRASLLEVWERYRQPRRATSEDYARGALRVVRDGSRVGVDPETLRLARLTYFRLYQATPPARRRDLPHPDRLAAP